MHRKRPIRPEQGGQHLSAPQSHLAWASRVIYVQVCVCNAFFVHDGGKLLFHIQGTPGIGPSYTLTFEGFVDPGNQVIVLTCIAATRQIVPTAVGCHGRARRMPTAIGRKLGESVRMGAVVN